MKLCLINWYNWATFTSVFFMCEIQDFVKLNLKQELVFYQGVAFGLFPFGNVWYIGMRNKNKYFVFIQIIP